MIICYYVTEYLFKIYIWNKNYNEFMKKEKNGSAGARTQDLSVISTTLYLLSYETFTFSLKLIY